MVLLPPLQQLGFGTSPRGSKETLHQACAQAEGGIIFFLAAQESAPGSMRPIPSVQFLPGSALLHADIDAGSLKGIVSAANHTLRATMRPRGQDRCPA
jgi:hypothetical protein